MPVVQGASQAQEEDEPWTMRYVTASECASFFVAPFISLLNSTDPSSRRHMPARLEYAVRSAGIRSTFRIGSSSWNRIERSEEE